MIQVQPARPLGSPVLRERDGAARDNKNLPIHRWVPWIAGFSGEFVHDAIETYLPHLNRANHLVLDPFAGVGTTLIEALKSGYPTVGYEINPFAALAARTKINAIDIDLIRFKHLADSFLWDLQLFEATIDSDWIESREQAILDVLRLLLPYKPLRFRSKIPFTSPPVEAKLLYASSKIDVLPEPFKNLFLLAFGAVLVSVSNYSYEPSLSSRPGAGKPLQLNASVQGALETKLRQMEADIDWAQVNYGSTWTSSKRTLLEESYLTSTALFNSVALAITSPPYMNNYHYLRNTRPQLYWLKLAAVEYDFKRLEQQNVGKFWQTVRQNVPVPLAPTLPNLSTKIDLLRSLNVDRGPYGGPGWANYVATYFNDIEQFTSILSQQLKVGGRAVVVIGNSIIQGIEFKVDEILGEIATLKGLSLEEDKIIRTKRVGTSILNSSVRNGKSLEAAQLYDAAVVLRRPV